MAGGSFIAMLRVGVFLFLIWAASRLTRLAPTWMCLSSIIFEITTGLIMSPSLAGLLPKEYSECLYAQTEDCETRYTLNHVQGHYAGCDYDAYMGREGFVMATSGGHGSAASAMTSGGSSSTAASGAMSSGKSGSASGGQSSAAAKVGSASAGSSGGHASASAGSAGHSSGGGHSSAPMTPAASSGSHDSGHSSAAPSTSAAHSGSAAADHSSAAAGSSAGHGSASSASHASAASASHGSAADHASAGSSHSSAASHSSAGSGSSHGSSHRRLAGNHNVDERVIFQTDMYSTPMAGHLLELSGYGERRLAGGATKGKTKYADYEECLVQSCKLHIANECTLTPNFFSFIGHIGVALMIFESGMHFDFDKAGEFGAQACLIAVLGTFLPLIFGTLAVMVLCGKDLFPEGLASGTALAPTSVGIALKLLNEAKVLQKDYGQTIICAAFVDDILSLVIFNCLFALGAGDIGFLTFLPAIIGVTLMIFIVWFAWAKHADNLIHTILNKLPHRPEKKLTPRDEVLFVMMVLLVIILGTGFFFTGTHLWGCFMAGMCLARNQHYHHAWVRQTKKMTTWMIRIFFSCTVAFAIPVWKLLSFEALWKGTIMGWGPCILTKVAAAFWRPDRFVIGWAMVGRAEFAYLIAQLAASSNMLSQDVFAVVIWALLWATVTAPFMFRFTLKGWVKKEAEAAAGGKFSAEESAQYDVDHNKEFEFRQSGHLPILINDDMEDYNNPGGSQEPKKIAEIASSAVLHKEVQKEAFVHSAVEEEERTYHETHEKAVLSANAHHGGSSSSDPHCPSCEHWSPGEKEDPNHAGAQGARGSGFLCCLFFRKIIIM